MSEDDTVASFQEQIEVLESSLEAAETEADLDDVEADLADLREDIEAEQEAFEPEAPDGEEDEEDVENPYDPLVDSLDDIETDIEAQRGPYASDVTDDLQAVTDEVADTRWTADGAAALVDPVERFLILAGDTLAEERAPPDDEPAPPKLATALEATVTAVEAADFDPDEHADEIAALLEATETLADAVDDAEAFSDLAVREQMRRDGFYDVLEHVKDFPPEWSALKVHEEQGNTEMILLALERFDSDFMERHCLDALYRLGDEAAVDAMLERVAQRNQQAVEILGATGDGSEDIVQAVRQHADAGDEHLRRATLVALGQIGATDAIQDVADQLEADDPTIRSAAARGLGLLGDTRAIAPLSTVLAEDESEDVRGAAAWALAQIGTAEALETLEDYTGDRNYRVQSEAERVAG